MKKKEEEFTPIDEKALNALDHPFQKRVTIDPDKPNPGLLAYYHVLNDPDRYGIDHNGIFNNHELLISVDGDEEGMTNSKLRLFSHNKDEFLTINLRTNELIWKFEDKEKKFCFKRCVCGGKIIKITGNNVHLIMEGGSGSTTTSRSGPGLSRISGIGRNYLTHLLEDGYFSGLSSLKYRIPLDFYNIGQEKVEVKTGKKPRKVPTKIIAVIDTGLDLFLSYKGSKSSFKLWENPRIKCSSICGDRFGYNFVDGNENVFDDHGHGTEVASVFVSNLGYRSKYRLMPLKAFDAMGNGGAYEISCAIHYAIAHGADVIIASWGSIHFDPNIYMALEKANAKGIRIFTACGNFGDQITSPATPFYPALFQVMSPPNHPKLTKQHSIAATAANVDDLWEGSNYFDNVLATDGEDVEVVTCSYAFATTQLPPTQFNYLRTLDPININGYLVDLNYVTKVVDGTSFAAPKAAAIWVRKKTMQFTQKNSASKGIPYRKLKT